MAFIKIDKASEEWVNLDEVVVVDVSGNDPNRTVRIWYHKNGTLTAETVATAANLTDAVAIARQVIAGTSKELDLT